MDDDNEDNMDTEIISLDEKRGEQGKKVARRVARQKSVQYESISRLKELKCFENVRAMVEEGAYAREIAEYIQDVAGEYDDVSLEAVTRAVRQYRESLEGVGIAASVESGSDAADGDPLYELQVLQEMFNKQKKRIEMETGTEKNLRKLFSTTHKEFEVLAGLGREILKQKRLAGIIGGDLDKKRRLADSSRMAGRLSYSEVVSNPESRHKVLSVVETLFGDEELMSDIIERGGIHQLTAGNEEESEGKRRVVKKVKKVKKKPKKKPPAKSKKKPKAKKNDSNDTKRATPVGEDD